MFRFDNQAKASKEDCNGKKCSSGCHCKLGACNNAQTDFLLYGEICLQGIIVWHCQGLQSNQRNIIPIKVYFYPGSKNLFMFCGICWRGKEVRSLLHGLSKLQKKSHHFSEMKRGEESPKRESGNMREGEAQIDL